MRILTVMLLLLIALSADAITGFSSTVSSTFTDAQTFQSAAAQCQLTQTGAVDASGCTGTITFPTAFTSIPTKFGISTQCMANTPQTLTGKTADQVCQSLGLQQGHLSTFIFAYIHFESDNGQTWTAMPAATTEIYGTTNHEQTSDLIGITQAYFSADILTVSSGATAFLRPQFLTGGGVWTDLASAAGGLDLSVNFLPGPAFIGTVPINPAAQFLGVNLRVVGGGGGGVGDNPAFNEITLGLSAQIPVSVLPNIGCSAGNAVCVSTTTMAFWVTAINPSNALGNLEPIFSWWACVC